MRSSTSTSGKLSAIDLRQHAQLVGGAADDLEVAFSPSSTSSPSRRSWMIVGEDERRALRAARFRLRRGRHGNTVAACNVEDTMTNGDAIAIRGVSKRFGDYAAVDDLTLTVPRGSVYGFIGPNGSGKTTTLRMTMNILLPDSGEIVVLGEKTTHAARDRVSYLPEERGLYKKMSVRDLLRYYGQLKSMPAARLERAIDEWLEKLQIADRAGLKIESLSKGQAQKVQCSIASVVAEPELLILDEPFSGLDPVNAESLKDAVLELRDCGTTVVFSTHDMSTAERLCDRIFMIRRAARRSSTGRARRDPGPVRCRHGARAHRRRWTRRRARRASPASTRSSTRATCRRCAYRAIRAGVLAARSWRGPRCSCSR